MSENIHDAIVVTTTPFERLLARLAARLLPLVPRTVTPNQVTLTSGVVGAAGGFFYLLADGGRGWLLAAAAAILVHMVLDVLDGCMARARDQKSDLGYFLDQFLDLLSFVALTAGIAASSYARFEIVILAPLLYAINLTVVLHSIHLRGTWKFPPMGPSEILAVIACLTLLTFVVPGQVAAPFGIGLTFLDLGFIAGMAVGLIETAVTAGHLVRQLARPRL